MIPVPYAANLATNGSGLISASVLGSSCPAATTFTSLATLFDEFFIESFKVFYQPSTRYQVVPSTTSSEFNGTPLGCASLFFDLTAYTNINQMPANPTFKFYHSSDPWEYTWVNNVKRKSAVSEEPDATHNSLSWVRTNATPAQYYGGAVSILGSASSAMHVSTTVGIIAVRYNVWFRSKS
jgi:glutathione peroxidase-family protein